MKGERRKPETHPPRAQEGPVRDGVDSLATSRRGLRDLAALLVLPAMWVDHDSAYIAAGLLDVLFGLLRLEIGYVRFDDPGGGPALERWRPDGPSAPFALSSAQAAAAAVPGRDHGAATVSLPTPTSDEMYRVTSMSPALPGVTGLVLVGSRREDFPTERELYMLQVAIGQAAIAIHTARRLASERVARLAAETALRLRNEFLATLAQDLSVPLARLSERVAQAQEYATAADQSSAFAANGADVSLDATAASRPGSDESLLVSPARLSRRQAEVLGLLAQGLSNKEIAGVLWLSERTVERHITSLYRKIGVERRSEATAFALGHSLVHPDAYAE